MDSNIGKILKEELSGNIAKSYVAQISRFHRIQASTMFREAAECVRDELLRIGLKNATIEQFLADGTKKYWTYTSPVGWTVKSAELRLMDPEQKLLVSYEDTPQCLHAYSNATPPEGVEAELVDVGAGTKSSNYEGKDVKGKFVLATGRARFVHEQAVYKYEAAGVITDSVLEMSDVRESIDVPDAHAYQSIWPDAGDLDKVKFGFSLSKRQGTHLRMLLNRGKPVRLKAKVNAKLFSGNLDVVTATIPGNSNPQEEVFLISHLCHPKPSANDNASGSGLLLEIARTINVLIESGRIPRPARTIRFIWVPETFGSIVYLNRHEDLTNRLVAGINLDMVGQNQELCKSTLNLDRTPDSLPSYLNDLVFKNMQESIKEFDKESPFGSSSTFRYATGAFSGGSDHAEFTDSTICIPCVMLLQWPDLYYHTSMDTIDKVSEESLKRVGWITAKTILTLADATLSTAFQLSIETASKGMERIEEAKRKAVDQLFRNSSYSEPKNIPASLGEYLQRIARGNTERIMHILWREKEAVKSVMKLAKGSELEDLIDEQCRNLDIAAKRANDLVKRTFKLAVELQAVQLPEKTEDEKEKKRLMVIPRRQFKGTLDQNFLRKSLDEKELEYYDEVREEDRDFDKKQAEVLNFMDGERTVREIVAAVSAEYSVTNPEHILRFLHDLERLQLIRLA